MEHAEATESKAAERYVLGEMTDPEAESFEEHYFDCAECASDVRDEMKVLEWGRELVREEHASAPVVPITSRRITHWLPLAAAAILVIGLGLPMLMRRDRAPSDGIARQLYLQGETRGTGDAAVKLGEEEDLVLLVDVPYDESAGFSRYELVVRDASGKTRKPHAVSAKDVEGEDPVALVLRGLPAGTQELTIEGVRRDGGRTKVATQSFVVQH